MKIDREIRAAVVKDCNDVIINEIDSINGLPEGTEYPSQWFVDQFEFLGDPKLAKHLGEAFYQARFAYGLKEALNLSKAKYYGLVKLQILLYVPICEAMLDHMIKKYLHSDQDYEELITYKEYKDRDNLTSEELVLIWRPKNDNNAPQNSVKDQDVHLCSVVKGKGDVRFVSSDRKADLACKKGLISNATKEKYLEMYDIRNNVHIMRAYWTDYIPKAKGAADAYGLVWNFITELKQYCEEHTADPAV